MYWTNVCVEGHCFARTDEATDCAPCGRNVPDPFCLMDHICPHFMWSGTTERRAALFPKLRLIIWDRLKIWVTETTYWKLRWWFWDQLWFNQRKTRKFFDNIKVVTAEDSPVLAQWEGEQQEAAQQFEEWFPGAKKDWENEDIE